jgi:hypothetical protein
MLLQTDIALGNRIAEHQRAALQSAMYASATNGSTFKWQEFFISFSLNKVTHCTYVCFLLIKPLSYCCKIKEKG